MKAALEGRADYQPTSLYGLAMLARSLGRAARDRATDVQRLVIGVGHHDLVPALAGD